MSKRLYSLPAGAAPAAKLPAVLLVDHRKGIPVWGNEQPLERNQWGNRAVLIVETLDRGSRALEQNLRSFSDNDLLHHMKRQAMVVGTTLESMQVYEILRSLELLRSLPNVDPARITVLGKGDDGVNGMYAALLDGKVSRVILHSPPASHVHGPHYLGVLRHTDIPRPHSFWRDGAGVWRSARPHAFREAVPVPGGVPAMSPPPVIRECALLDVCGRAVGRGYWFGAVHKNLTARVGRAPRRARTQLLGAYDATH